MKQLLKPCRYFSFSSFTILIMKVRDNVLFWKCHQDTLISIYDFQVLKSPILSVFFVCRLFTEISCWTWDLLVSNLAAGLQCFSDDLELCSNFVVLFSTDFYSFCKNLRILSWYLGSQAFDPHFPIFPIFCFYVLAILKLFYFYR